MGIVSKYDGVMNIPFASTNTKASRKRLAF
jgi:hypothetical protein